MAKPVIKMPKSGKISDILKAAMKAMKEEGQHCYRNAGYMMERVFDEPNYDKALNLIKIYVDIEQ